MGCDGIFDQISNEEIMDHHNDGINGHADRLQRNK